ncbi:purine-nucleoside phosphorylase [Congregibacter litoralis]|uniref:Purine nucleoside permease n=1 Tax=Congregibacter litoralis KT71 TaxID=314285 RepID=A4A8X2_9GAMM|nr:purine nucleoside permease [Congregibacter litoralis]EAQ97514.1 Purine nucleoside permease [Congregibacter litoralis KT71]
MATVAFRQFRCALTGFLALGVASIISSADAADAGKAPIEIRVAVLVNFEVGDDRGDAPGEFQAWRERGLDNQPLDECFDLPFSTHEACVDRESGLLVTFTGLTQDRAAASVMALGLDERFDFSHSYWIIGGIAGIDPGDGTLGSAVWGNYVVNGDWAHEIDAREMPEDWKTGYFPFMTGEPYPQPRADDTGKVFALNQKLAAWAYEESVGVKLFDNAAAKALRDEYQGFPQALAPPKIMRGDNLSASTFWHGRYLNEWANDWVAYWTEGDGEFVTTAVEDSGILEALRFLDGGGRVDFDRIMLLRTASNFSMQPPGMTAVESLTRETEGFGGMLPAVENLWRVGSKVAGTLIADWEQYRTTPPGN